MPHARGDGDVLVVRLDRDGNLHNYETSERSNQPIVVEKSSRLRRVEPADIYEDERHQRYYVEEDDDDIQQSRPAVILPPRQKIIRNPTIKTVPRRRRLRYIPPKSTVKIFDKKPRWEAYSKLDTQNDEAIELIERQPRRKIVNEHVTWHAKPKIDTHNEEAVEQYRNERRPIIFDENSKWSSKPRIDNYNEDYIRYKEHEQSYRQKHPQEGKPRVVRVHLDDQNSEYDDYRRQYRSGRNSPVENQEYAWQARSRVDHRNYNYIQRRRKEPPALTTYKKKPRWNYAKSTLDNHNEDYKYNVKEQPKPRIVNQLPEWRSRPKINTFNDTYPTHSNKLRPVIYDEKPYWYARSKLDTGFVSEDDEYADYG